MVLKIDKETTPLCPILSRIGSTNVNCPNIYLLYFSLFWICILQTVSKTPSPLPRLSMILTLKLPFSVLLTSVACLQNIPLDETINICTGALYNSNLILSSFSKKTFCQLMYSASKFLEFNFDNTMYQQIDGLPWVILLVLLLPIFLWDFTNNYFLKTLLNLFFISDMYDDMLISSFQIC